MLPFDTINPTKLLLLINDAILLPTRLVTDPSKRSNLTLSTSDIKWIKSMHTYKQLEFYVFMI